MAVGVFGLICLPVVLLHQAYLAPAPRRPRRGPARWWRAGSPGATPSLTGRGPGAGDRAGPGRALARADVRPPRLGRLAALLAPFDPWFPHDRAAGAADRPRPGDVAAGPLRRRPAGPPGPDRRERGSRDRRRGLLGDLAGRGGCWSRRSGRAVRGRFGAVPAGAAEPAGRAGDRRPGQPPDPGPDPDLARPGDGRLRRLADQHQPPRRGRGPLHGRVDSTTALGLHLALDLLIAVVLFTRGLDRWARRRDDRQRRVLAGFLAAVLAVTAAAGIREVRFRHSETNDLLMLRTMILRRDRDRPFDLVAVVSPDASRYSPTAPPPAAGSGSSSARPCPTSRSSTSSRPTTARPARRPAAGDPRRQRPAALVRRPVAARPRGDPPRPRRLRHRPRPQPTSPATETENYFSVCTVMSSFAPRKNALRGAKDDK